MKGTGYRRSARISALEEKNRLLALQKDTKGGQGSSGVNDVSSSTAKRRGRKRKRLQETAIKSVAVPTCYQEDESSKDEDTSINAEDDSSSQRMPKKQALEFILDILQRRDTQELFAQPVDSNEVDGYYNVVKEPMDFGTMRAKLQEGMYTSLEQFERDVFLISSNAMKFYSSTTLFYKEARSISELAKRLFHSLRTEPENFDLEYSRTRRRPVKQPQDEAGCSNAELHKPGFGHGVRNPSVKRNTSRYSPCLNQHIYNNYNRGTVAGRGSSSSDTERRMTYLPKTSFPNKKEPIFSAIYECPKQLNYVRGVGMQYRDSLMQFVKDLGPKAQRVANKKLERLIAEASNLPSQAPNFSGNILDGLVLALPQQIVKDMGPNIMFANDKLRTSATEAPNCLSLTPTHVNERTPTFADCTAPSLVPESSERFIKDMGPTGNISASTRHGKLSNEAPNSVSFSQQFSTNNAAKNLVPEQSDGFFKDLGPKAQMFADTRQSRLSSKAPSSLSLTPEFNCNNTSENLVSEHSWRSSKDLRSMTQLQRLGTQKFPPLTPYLPGNHTADNLVPKQSEILFKDLGPKTLLFSQKRKEKSSLEASDDQLLIPKFLSNHIADNVVPAQSAKFVNKQGSMKNMFLSNAVRRSSAEAPNFLKSTPIYSGNRTEDGLVTALSRVQRPGHLNEVSNEQLSQNFSCNSLGPFRGKMAFSIGGTSNFNFDRPMIPTPQGEQEASTHVKGGFNISALLGERMASIGKDGNAWSSPKEKNIDTSDSMNLLNATLMQHNNFESQTNHTKSVFNIPCPTTPSQLLSSSKSLQINNPCEPFSSLLRSNNLSNQENKTFFHGLMSKSPNAEGLNASSLAAVGQEYGAKSGQGQATQPVEWNQNAPQAAKGIFNLMITQIPATEHISSFQNELIQQQPQGAPTQEVPSLHSMSLFEGAFLQDHNSQPTAQCFWDTPQQSFLDNQQPDLALQL